MQGHEAVTRASRGPHGAARLCEFTEHTSMHVCVVLLGVSARAHSPLRGLLGGLRISYSLAQHAHLGGLLGEIPIYFSAPLHGLATRGERRARGSRERLSRLACRRWLRNLVDRSALAKMECVRRPMSTPLRRRSCTSRTPAPCARSTGKESNSNGMRLAEPSVP